jgi:hypothetical protein
VELIILGTGSSCVYCPFDCETWGVNGAYTIKDNMPDSKKDSFRLDKLFLTDYLYSAPGFMNFDIDGMNRLTENGTEIITMHPMKLGKHVLKAKKYPFKEVLTKFNNDYFTDTITYMIAYALYKYTRKSDRVNKLELKEPLFLKLYGVDMVTTVEFRASKGGVEWWLGIAQGLGAEIYIAKGSSILANPRGFVYGWEREFNDTEKYDPLGLLSGKYDESKLYDFGGDDEEGISDPEQND